jgi:hypothetical protein
MAMILSKNKFFESNMQPFFAGEAGKEQVL